MEQDNLADYKHVVNEPSNDALLCEAVGCFAEATNTIEVKAGNHRTISLSLCNDCVYKFRNE
jgi:hypothetical protein